MAQFDKWSDQLEEALAAPFPKDAHLDKGRKGIFVPVHEYVARLNDLVGVAGWSSECRMFQSGNKLCMAVGLNILGVEKWNVGDEQQDHGDPVLDEHGKEKVVDYGSSTTNAWAQAFKRTCAYGFKLGFYLYDKQWTQQYVGKSSSYEGTYERPAAAKPAPPRQPVDPNAEPLDQQVGFGKKYPTKTWRELLAMGEEGTSFVAWALDNYKRLDPALREPLKNGLIKTAIADEVRQQDADLPFGAGLPPEADDDLPF